MVVDGGQRRSDVLLAPLRFAFHARRTAREADSAVTAWAESRRRTDNHETAAVREKRHSVGASFRSPQRTPAASRRLPSVSDMEALWKPQRRGFDPQPSAN